MSKLLVIILVLMSFGLQAQISIIGPASPSGNWTTDHNLTETPTGSNVWTGTFALTVGDLKFRQNNDWAVNWGDVTYPSGVGILNGPNIPITQVGLSNITFNINTNEYSFSHINSAPVAADDSGSTAEDTDFNVSSATLLSNDTDIDNDPLSLVSVFNPVNGTVVLSNGQITFTPSPNFYGTASFTYSVSDGFLSDYGQVNIDVFNVNHPPVATDDRGSTAEDTDFNVSSATLLSNDTDIDNDPLSLVSVFNPVNGTVVLSNGQITFTPSPNFYGTASFTYSVSDGFLSDYGQVVVNVLSGNIGIGVSVPIEKLDVAGSIKTTGEIKPNGIGGATNQVLTSNGDGTMHWAIPEANFTHYIGQLYGGGVIVALWKTGTEEHGLIVSSVDLGESIFSNISSTIGMTSQSRSNGITNTNSIVNQTGHTTSAAQMCLDYIFEGFNDWYLPSSWEMNHIIKNAQIINEVLGTTNGINESQFSEYWNSTEYESAGISYGGSADFVSLTVGNRPKSTILKVRAIRKF